MNSLKFSLSAICVLISLCFSCRKLDKETASFNQEYYAEKFLSLPISTSPEARRVAQKLTFLNTTTKFLNTIAKRDGYPVWDKAIIHKLHPTSNRQNFITENGSDTIVYIPLVKENGTQVTAFILGRLNDTVSLQLHRAENYARYGFGGLDASTHNADRLAMQFMLLDYSVFGYIKFKLLNDSLFTSLTPVAAVNSDSTSRYLEFNDTIINNSARGGTWEPGSISHCGYTYSYHCNLGGSCTTSWCDRCSMCVSMGWNCTTTTVYYFVPDENDPPGGEGGTGGGGGGSGPTGPEYCNPTPELDNGFPPCTGDGGNGWEPEIEYDPYIADNVILDTSITNNFPCVESLLDTLSNYGNLNQQAQVALSQIFGINKRIKTTIKLDRALVGTNTSAYTKRTGTTPSDASDTAQLNFEATIFVNPDILQNSTKEYIITTFVHEAMHAYINYIFTLYNQGYLLPADSGYIKSKFPIFWGGISPTSAPSEIQQHNLIALNWVLQVSAPLYGFTNNSINPALKDSIYHALGWGGLESTDIFKLRPDKCDVRAINIVARNKNQGAPFTIPTLPQCTSQYNITAQSLNLKNLCD